MTGPEFEFAWAVGLFEGEGTFFCRTERPYQRRMSFSSVDADVVFRFHSAVGGIGYVTGPYVPSQPNRQPFWRWQVNRWDDLAPLVERFLPHLGVRRAEAARKILANPTRKNWRKERCKRGHLLAATARITTAGHRQCKECLNLRQRERRAMRERPSPVGLPSGAERRSPHTPEKEPA